MIFKGPEAFGFGAFCLSCNSGKNRAVPDFCVIIECSATFNYGNRYGISVRFSVNERDGFLQVNFLPS